MSIEKSVSWTAAGLCIFFSACSGGGGSSSTPTNAMTSAIQDLSVDPDGLTTVLTFDKDLPALALGDVVADDGQSSTSVTIVANVATVEWDDRVPPSSRVRITGHAKIDNDFVAVTSSDTSVPAFTITDGDQVAGLGNDTIEVTFSGPRVIESEAEDAGNWSLIVDTVAMDLTGSTFVLDTASQILTITTGDMANLHATFRLSADAVHSVSDIAVDSSVQQGAATGDSSAPTLLSVEQNLAEDEFGRVIDITFSEAMDPVFCNELANFIGNSPDLAIGFEQPSGDVLRISFNNPMVPGIDQFDLANLIDAAGNAFVDQTVAIAAGSTIANDWAIDPVLATVADQGHDYVYAELEQALDPDDAEVFSHWTLTIDPSGAATVIDLSTATFDYDMPAKSLTITLPGDLVTGDDFNFAANAADYPHDVDGEDFQGTFDGQISGDAVAPTLVTSEQNRNFDPSGKTIDVTFSEDVDEALAETLVNWSVTGVNVTAATRLANRKRVRLDLDAPALPGDATLDVSGIADLAGNMMTAVVGAALTTTDLTAPTALSATAVAVEGDDNDTLVVPFDDAMYEADAEDVANWSVESPTGTVLDLSSATIDYRNGGHFATLTFGAGTNIDLQGAASFSVSLATMRDVGGNALTSVTLTGTVSGEQTLPTVSSVWVESAASNNLHLRFSEPCEFQDDIAGLSVYVVRDNAGVIKGYPVTATSDSDALGVALQFGFAIVAGSDTLDIAGIADLAGNPMFPANDLAISAEDPSELGLDVGVSTLTTLSGELNDTIEIVFDRMPSPWMLLDSSHYEVSLVGTPIDLAYATFEYDGNQTVTITLSKSDAESLLSGSTYDVTINDIQSVQGVDMSATSTDMAMASGDSTSPSLPVGACKLDAANPTTAVLIELSEALDPSSVDVNLIDLNGAVLPDTAELLGYRTVRATFSGGVVAGDTLNIAVSDLAGNSGILSRVVTSADSTGPLVVSVVGTAVAGSGGDYITVLYNKQVELGGALSASNYTITNGGSAIDASAAVLTWDSSTLIVTILLPTGQDLQPGLSLNVQVDGIYDHAALAMSPAANIFGLVGGDAIDPDFGGAFANYRADASGIVIDVLFDEDVEAAFAGDSANWSVSGGQSVDAVETMTGSWYRLTLSAPIVAGDMLLVTGVPDLAGNASTSISIAPQL